VERAQGHVAVRGGLTGRPRLSGSTHRWRKFGPRMRRERIVCPDGSPRWRVFSGPDQFGRTRTGWVALLEMPIVALSRLLMDFVL
jgi:hypothetical protein